MSALTTGDEPVVLADFDDAAAAQRLADRLVAEGIGARVWAAGVAAFLPAAWPPQGPTVMVRRGDEDDARILASLFDEIDRGVSHVAPAQPSSAWRGTPERQLVAVGAVAVVLCALLLAIVAAVVP